MEERDQLSEEDVEGHKRGSMANDDPLATEDEDVEGHGRSRLASDDGDSDDVEAHGRSKL